MIGIWSYLKEEEVTFVTGDIADPVTLYFIGPLVNAILDMQMRRGPEGPPYIGKKKKKVKKIAF